jgi:uncharacterized protein YjbI with pentapeptide repeats
VAPVRSVRLLQIGAVMFPLVAVAAAAHADICQWEYINPADPSQGKEQSTTLCPDGAGVDAVPGAQLWGRNLTMAYRIGMNLTNANFGTERCGPPGLLIGCDYLPRANLASADFTAADLRGAAFTAANLTDVNFTDANIQAAIFDRYADDLGQPGTGISLAQLYSTASYKERDLSGIRVPQHYFAGANLSGQNLTGANLTYSDLTGTDFTAADVRGAVLTSFPANAITTNLIRPDGHINGLVLDGGGLLVVRDYDGNPNNTLYPYNPIPPIPITIDQHLSMALGGTLRMVFEADAWDSTISFAPGIPVTLGGTLELTFADDVNLASQLGRTFDLFDWTGVTPTGAFAVSSPYAWDLSNLYTTGEITLAAIPETTTVVLLIMAAGMCVNRHRTIAFVS